MASQPRAAVPLHIKGYGHVITWSQCATERDAARAFMYEALDAVERTLRLVDAEDRVSAGVEQHEDGNYHVHIGLVRAQNKMVKVGRRLDVQGIHPNVQPHVPTTASLRAALAYPLKEDEEGMVMFDEDIEDLFDPPPGRTAAPADRPNAWRNAMEAASYEDALEILRVEEPREYILRHREIVEFFSKYFAPEFTPTYTVDQFVLDPIDWDDVPLRNSVVVTGPPNLGKTQYSIAQLGEKPFLCTHIDVLRKFNGSIHTGILFDEISIAAWPPTAVINILDRELPRDIHVRYGTVHLPPGIRKIFCVNALASLIPEKADMIQLDAINDRMTKIEITDRTY